MLAAPGTANRNRIDVKKDGKDGRTKWQSLDRCFSLSAATVLKGRGSPYSITERRVPELIPVLGSQFAGDVSHKPGGRLPLLFARPAVTVATLKRDATNFAAWWTDARRVWTVCRDCYPTASRLRYERGPFCAWVQHANHSAIELTSHRIIFTKRLNSGQRWESVQNMILSLAVLTTHTVFLCSAVSVW